MSTCYADYSTAHEALEPHKGNKVVDLYAEYQTLKKLKGTYVDGYRGTPDKPGHLLSGRIHANFKPHGARTGRFSSSDPNLQNVPRPGTEWSTRVRALFRAPVGFKLLVADYAQIELRVLAHFLGMGALFEGFLAGVDAHTATAALLFGVDWADVTETMRQVAKGVNFAVVFGAGPDTVAAMAHVSVKQAREFMRIHQRMFPEIYRYKEHVIRVCRQMPEPYVETIIGRVRRLPEIRYRDPQVRALAERQAINSRVQGSAGDLIKLSMMRFHRSMPKNLGPESGLVLTVHDELVVQWPEDRVDEGVQLLHEAMCGAEIQKMLSVPLIADAKIVDTWAQAK